MINRDFPPGAEWLYYKFYIGPATANSFLVSHIQPLAKELLQEEVLDSWFFLRYHDPEPHLRVRFHLCDLKHFEKVVSEVKEVLARIGREKIWKFEIATYSRELERYGPTTMEATEKLFFHDSQTILSLLACNLSDEQYFLAMLKMTDIRLNNFDLHLEAKGKILQGLQLNFKQEYNSDPRMIKSLSIKYRSLYPEISKILDPKIQGNNIVNQLLEKNSFLTLPIIEKIKGNEKEMARIGKMNYLASLLHMNINRMFRSEQRVYEMLLYDFLYQYYNSELKRIQKS